MPNEQITLPYRFHCRELDGDQTGILTLSEKGVELYFISYDDAIYLPADQPTHVVIEDGRVVSLHANVPGRLSSTAARAVTTANDSEDGEIEYRQVSHSGIISNLALVGSDAWKPERLVRQLTFEIEQTGQIFRHIEKVRSLGSATFPSISNYTLYRTTSGSIALIAGYSITYRMDTQSVTGYKPVFSIESVEGFSIDRIEFHLFKYLSFLSFNTGVPAIPKNVRVNGLTFEMLRASRPDADLSGHEVYWNWPTLDYDTLTTRSRGAPFLALDDHELSSLVDGLASWVERFEIWERSYVRMAESLRLRHQVSGERLLASWRWFEEIPVAGAEVSFDGSAIEPVIEAAIEAAHRHSIPDVDVRIRSSLRRIGEETMRRRFERLTESVSVHFGGTGFIDEIVSELEHARAFRGRIAHGHFSPRDEAEGNRFNKATLAMEVLCLLLTARDLPMTEQGRSRIWSHPVLEEYRLAFP